MFRKSARGLFDLLVASMALATLVTTTPAGELLLRGGRWALGLPGGHRADLTSFFGSPGQPASPALGPPAAGSVLASVARAYGAAPALLKGFALASASDPAAPELALDRLSPEGLALLRSHGASEADLATGPGRLRAVSRAIGELTADLGSPDAALAALVLGLRPVQYAVERVRAERREATLAALAAHLSPSDRARADATVGLALTLATAYDLAWPVAADARIASRFGARVDPLSGRQAHHTGIDLAIPTGTAVLAAADGVVARAGEDGLNGRFLVVDHGRGVTSAYCHNSELRVARGARVAKGAIVALSGNTGRSTGPHLHYQVAIEGVPVDPLALGAAERAEPVAGK